MTSDEKMQESLDSIVNSKNMGGKKYHSESELQQYGEDEEGRSDTNKDPGVLNASIGSLTKVDQSAARQRALSQPGPLAGNLVTASATRANRKRPGRSVNYAANLGLSESADGPPFKFLTAKGDESGTATPNERTSPLPYNNINNYRNANGDVKSINSYRIYTPVADSRGGATPRKRSVATMDAQSIRSVETQAPPPTSPEDNKKMTRKYLSLLLSSMYAVLLVTLGLLAHIGDVFTDLSVSAYYSIALISIGFLYHLFLIIDIQIYKNSAQKQQKLKAIYDDKMDEYFRKQEEDPGISMSGSQSLDYRQTMPPILTTLPLKHTYCFSQGRHSGSFYLKLGAAGFAMGHLIHSVLLITVQLAYLQDENIDNDKCVAIETVVLDFLSPFYSFFQLYFIFKYSNVIILKYQPLANFAFMHMIGSSLCFWISAIVRETILALTIYVNAKYNRGYGDEYNNNNSTAEASQYSGDPTLHISVDNLYNPDCIGNQAVVNIVENFSPYLYPFSVEFNILIVAVYYIIWTNIGNCENGDDDELSLDDNTTVCKLPTATEDNDFTSNIVIHADCHASNRGLFGGLVLIVVVAGSLIVGFVFSSGMDEYYPELGNTITNAMKLALHSVLLITAVFAYHQTRKLDINEHSNSLLDGILLFVCLPAFFMETVLSMVATIQITNIMRTVDFVIMVLQVIVQTPLIIDALRRCSNTRKLRRTKPGRELLMFLIIANVGMWLFNTFSYKSPDSMDERYEFYGKVPWTILGHVSLPLIMFYRFHSSVCFADIWDSAYKPGSEH